MRHYEKRLKDLDGGRWDKEYGGIRDGVGSPAKASEDPANATKNRYKNIVAYDHSRVTVASKADNGNSEYINANWVDSAWGPKTFIATQGPVPDSMFR